MTAQILDGNEIAIAVQREATAAVADFRLKNQIVPGLAVALVGDDPASHSYVRRKERACQEVGIYTETISIPSDTSQDRLLAVVSELNSDTRVHGILIQLPLPAHIDQDAVITSIDPIKDVDGLHPQNAGLLLMGRPRFVPATPLGVQRILTESAIETQGAHVVILGRSSLVGRPLSILLTQRGRGANATVTICHTGTKQLAEHTLNADIVIAAAGVPNTITAEMVRKDAVVIDVGVSRVHDPSRKRGYRLTGDVDYDAVVKKAAAITPVPGGVGPMTVAMLLHNVLLAAKLQCPAINHD